MPTKNTQINAPVNAPRNYLQKKVAEAKRYLNKKKKVLPGNKKIALNGKGLLSSVRKHNQALEDSLKY